MGRVSSAAIANPLFRGNVAIIANNSIEYVEALLGITDVGTTVATINPKSTPIEVTKILADCGARVLLIDPELYREEYGRLVDQVITFGDQYSRWRDSYQELPLDKYPIFDDSTIFSIVYTSGTTGSPKGLTHSHRKWMMLSLTMALDYNRMREGDITLTLASLSNGYGWGTSLVCLNSGGTVILGTQVHPDYIMRMIEQHKVTTMYTVPAVLNMIVNTRSVPKYNIGSLTGIISSSSFLPVDTKLKAIKLFGNIVYDQYASTECGPVAVAGPSLINKHPTAVGYPIYGSTIQIRRSDGHLAEPDEVGQIFAETLTMHSGLVNQGPPDRFISVGDLGYKDPSGLLYVVGRQDDMIITGGNKVHPEEVEAIINSCPGVVESAVVGIRDDIMGETVQAFIVGEPEIDIKQYCRQYLIQYKIPTQIQFLDSIPRTNTGKIVRGKLRNFYK